MTETQKNSTEMISRKGQIVVLKLKRESRENDHDKEKEGNKNREYLHKYWELLHTYNLNQPD